MKPPNDTPPGPKGNHMLQAFGFSRDPLGFLTRLAETYGDISGFQIRTQRVFLLNHPDYIRDVFLLPAEHFRKGPTIQRVKRLLGEGLLTSTGNHHKRQRKFIQPAFHTRRIAEQSEIITGYGEKFATAWQDGETRDVHLEMRHLTLAIIGRLLFSTDMEAELADSVTQELTDSMKLLNLLGAQRSSWVKRLTRRPLVGARRSHQPRRNIDADIYRILDERKRNGSDRGDILSMLLSARDDEGGMSDQQVRDEVMTLIHAGHETTANALAWTWYLLTQNPEADAKLHREIDSVLAGRLPTFEDLPRLAYTEMVLLEAMRLYPPGWLVGRHILKSLEVGGYTLPADSLLLVSQYVMHRDARYFPVPSQFDPERWTPEARNQRPQFSYFPFGGGHRRCIGESLALMEGVLLIATIGRRWRMRLINTQPVKPQAFITLRPKGGMVMKMERRGLDLQ